MTTTKDIREQIKTILEANTLLAGIPVLLERTGSADIEAAYETALADKGLVLVVMEADSGRKDSTRTGSAKLKLRIPVAIFENPARNNFGFSSEVCVIYTIAALIGYETGQGELDVDEQAFAREGSEDENGVIEHYVGIEAPLLVRRAA